MSAWVRDHGTGTVFFHTIFHRAYMIAARLRGQVMNVKCKLRQDGKVCEPGRSYCQRYLGGYAYPTVGPDLAQQTATSESFFLIFDQYGVDLRVLRIHVSAPI